MAQMEIADQISGKWKELLQPRDAFPVHVSFQIISDFLHTHPAGKLAFVKMTLRPSEAGAAGGWTRLVTILLGKWKNELTTSEPWKS